jgi:hypothetical protein
MDNYFILSSKVGDKWTKVTSDMTSVKLGTCIHIVGELSSLGDFSHGYLTNGGGTTIILTITFHEEFTVIPETHSVIQSMIP